MSRHDVPPVFQEAHVENYFRPLHQPWSFYIRSLFRLHNEFMNVWTHIIAFLLTAVQLWHFSCDMDFVNDSHTWPMLAGFVCGLLLYICSSFAHWAQSKSEYIHYVAFMVDYAGIGLYSLGSVIVHLMYCAEEDFLEATQAWFIPLGCMFAIAISFCHNTAKVKYTRPYPFARKLWQMIPIACVYVLLISPVAHRLFTCFWRGADCTASIPFHCQEVMWFLISGFFFASDIPQRFGHGKFDIFLHSHQLFHTSIAICTLFQMQGVYIDFLTRSSVIHERPNPTFISAFGPVLFTILSEICCIVYFSGKVARKLKMKES